jgi:hypothetical protein
MPASDKSEKEQGASEYQKQKQVVNDLLSSAESACLRVRESAYLGLGACSMELTSVCCVTRCRRYQMETWSSCRRRWRRSR